MIPRHLVVAASFGLVLAAASTSSAETRIVQMATDANYEPRFIPAELTIRPGDTVRWVNTDTYLLDHATESGTGSADPLAGAVWSSGVIHAGESFEVTFDQAGDYVYFSPPYEYEGMSGTIHVDTGLGVGDGLQESTWALIKQKFERVLPR